MNTQPSVSLGAGGIRTRSENTADASPSDGMCECRAAVAQLEHGLGVYRKAAVQWSADSLATRPQQFIIARRQPVLSLRWAMAAMIPIVLLLIALLPFRVSNPRPAQPAAQISTAQIE